MIDWKRFWILGHRAYPDGSIVPDSFKKGILVIEDFAYQKLSETKNQRIDSLTKTNALLREALEKIQAIAMSEPENGQTIEMQMDEIMNITCDTVKALSESRGE